MGFSEIHRIWGRTRFVQKAVELTLFDEESNINTKVIEGSNVLDDLGFTFLGFVTKR